jgi:pimeloyl-ACP methyl ester carboxylesterase
MAAAIPRARSEIIPQSGHLVAIEQPMRVNALLREWLDEVRWDA